MTKCFFTGLLFLNVFFIGLSSCKRKPSKTKEAKRIEKLLAEAHLQSKDTVQYIVWNTTSCGGCRSYTAKLLQECNNNEIKFIVPLSFVNDIAFDNDNVFVDSQGIFGKYYFGVDNIGVVKVYNNEVFSIKNYQANEMDSLKIDLGE